LSNYDLNILANLKVPYSANRIYW